MSAAILVLALGPVQEFIAAARTTRDLWFGSELLSRAARAAALALRDEGARLVFPAPEALEDGDASIPVPNKIVAVVKGDPATLARCACQAAHDYLRGQRDAALRAVDERGGRAHVDADVLDRQLDDFLECYAAWWPYHEDDDGDYARARREAEGLLAGRKALRDFAPANGRPDVPKSLLDGGREAVIRTDLLARNDEGLALLGRLGIKPGELLDGVSLVKRLAPRGQRRFVSVSRVAADPLVRRLKDDPRMGMLRDIAQRLADQGSPLVQRIPDEQRGLGHFAPFPYDTELFFDDGSRDEALATDKDDKKQGRDFYRLVEELRHDIGAPMPPPYAYLAVLVADGDRVGAAIGRLSERGPEAHVALSQAGSRFAHEAGAVVARHSGALVYSGGDDVLAFLPLDTALYCAGALRDAFAETMGSLGLGEETPTLSVGIAIGHYNERLSDLLQWGRDAEGRAKRDRDMLAVALHARSGGAAVTAAHRWGDDPLARWDRWIDGYRRGALPHGAAYELRALAQELRALRQAGSPIDTDTLARCEAGRILGRKRSGDGEKLSEDDIAVIVGAAPPSGSSDAAGDTLDRLEMVVGELLIARDIARAVDVARGRLGLASATVDETGEGRA